MGTPARRRDDGNADTLSNYLTQIGRHPLLTADQEIELAQRIEAGRESAQRLEQDGVTVEERRRLQIVVRRGDDARDRFVQSNLRLVVAQARRYRQQKGIEFIDLVQEGNLGLMRAVDKFEWRRGFKFSTYATWWIRQAISRALAEKARTLRIPGQLHETVVATAGARSRFQAENGRDPSLEELATEAGVDRGRVEEALAVAEPLSLEAPVGDDGAIVGDFVEGYDESDPAGEAIERAVADELLAAVERLEPRERRIMMLRYGFADGVTRTHAEIGADFGLTPERIRQIEKRALCRLRHPAFGLREEALV